MKETKRMNNTINIIKLYMSALGKPSSSWLTSLKDMRKKNIKTPINIQIALAKELAILFNITKYYNTISQKGVR